MSWSPHITVAAVVEQEGSFLLVEEKINGQVVINQPAGHLNENETIVDAVVRETLEETGWNFVPRGLLGIYQWTSKANSISYIRFAFTGELAGHNPDYEIDSDILRVIRMTDRELEQAGKRHRSPLVMECIRDYRNSARLNLSLFKELI